MSHLPKPARRLSALVEQEYLKQTGLGSSYFGSIYLGSVCFGSKLFGLNFGLTAIFWDKLLWDKFLSGKISFFWDKFPYGQISMDEFSRGQTTLKKITETYFQCTLNVSISSHFTGKKNLVTNRWVPQYLKKNGKFPTRGGLKILKTFPTFFYLFLNMV